MSDLTMEPMTELALDSDGDGFAETVVIDSDADGIADIVATVDPYSGAAVALIDTDADGMFDTTAIDYDGDGYVDEVVTDGTVVDDTVIDDTVIDDTVIDDTVIDDTVIDDTVIDPDPFDGADDGIHGDPMTETVYHQAQPGPYDCLPTSLAMVMSEFSGSEIDASLVVDQANGAGFMTSTGMLLEDGEALLEANGYEAEMTYGSMDDLRTALDEGANVIVGLDADDLYGAGDPFGGDDVISGHAVVITGIDDEAGLVYVNDPGFPDGAGVAIPIEQFEDAWQDMDNQMLVVDDPGTELARDAYVVPVSMRVSS